MPGRWMDERRPDAHVDFVYSGAKRDHRLKPVQVHLVRNALVDLMVGDLRVQLNVEVVSKQWPRCKRRVALAPPNSQHYSLYHLTQSLLPARLLSIGLNLVAASSPAPARVIWAVDLSRHSVCGADRGALLLPQPLSLVLLPQPLSLLRCTSTTKALQAVLAVQAVVQASTGSVAVSTTGVL